MSWLEIIFWISFPSIGFLLLCILITLIYAIHCLMGDRNKRRLTRDLDDAEKRRMKKGNKDNGN